MTAVVSFRDLSIRSSYSAAEDRVNDFFVPVLNQALSYDRVTGYFKPSSLASVARGLARFVGHGGTMRLIAGAELDDLDVQALEDGESLSDVVARRLLADPIEGADIIAERRLETLAWLVREGRLEIRIGVPTDHLGRPLRPDQTLRYFHAKYGVFTDEDGNRIAFDGSNNETAAGYVCNYEVFSVFPSWSTASRRIGAATSVGAGPSSVCLRRWRSISSSASSTSRLRPRLTRRRPAKKPMQRLTRFVSSSWRLPPVSAPGPASGTSPPVSNRGRTNSRSRVESSTASRAATC